MKTIITCSPFNIFSSRPRFSVIALALTAFALVQSAQAVNPPPDGGYPGGNTAEGDNALFNLTTGTGNTAIGSNALFNNTTGRNNTAEGDVALQNNTTGIDNTAIGVFALTDNTIGNSNTAIGFFALFGNTTGNSNTATGVEALINNSTGSNNTATGFNALLNNTIGRNNTAEGSQALINNIMGINNAGVGGNALFSNTTGNLNVALGVNSLLRNTTGNSNIALGANAGSNLTIGNNNIDIGNAGVADEGNTTRIGTQGTQKRAFIAGISGTAVTGSPVVVNASGQLGVAASSERFKDEIKRMNNVSEAILALQPVTFRYKKTIDPDRIPQFGLVAEEVAKVNPDLVARGAKGEVYTVRYEAVNAMLLNEFIKAHCKSEQQEKIIAELRSGMTALAATVKEQASQIQKVSAQLEASKPAPQVVNNP